jgi:hypothetical protein
MPDQDELLRRFYRRVWERDVGPLLRGRLAAQRARSARLGGAIAASAGSIADKLLRLRGRPFTRFMAVMGSSLGAMLPDAWDWTWFRQADRRTQRVVRERAGRAAAALPEAEALGLFGLTPADSREELRRAWRAITQRCHPDKARGDQQRVEFHLRFLTYRAAYDRLIQAYDEGRLPIAPGGSDR